MTREDRVRGCLNASTQMLDALVDLYEPQLKLEKGYKTWQESVLELVGSVIGLSTVVALGPDNCQKYVNRIRELAVTIDKVLVDAKLANPNTHTFQNMANSVIGIIMDTLWYSAPSEA